MPFQVTASTAVVMAALPSTAVPGQLGLARVATRLVDLMNALVGFVPRECGVSPPNSMTSDLEKRYCMGSHCQVSVRSPLEF
jgi:hypothetical protein